MSLSFVWGYAKHGIWKFVKFWKKYMLLYYRMFPPAIDIISTSLAVAYSDGKYTN